MEKYFYSLTSGIILVLLFFSNLAARQTTTANPDSVITDERLTLIILPAATQETINSPLNQDLTDVIVDIARRSGRFNVVSIDDVGEMPVAQHYSRSLNAGDSIIVNLGIEFGCDEAVIVDALEFSQVGIPPDDSDEHEEDDRNIFEIILDGIFSGDSDEDYTNNIQTKLSVNIRTIDLYTSEYFDDINITVLHTGGDVAASKNSTLQKFRTLATNEIKKIYQLVSQVIAINGNDLKLHLGKNIGITEKTVFQIFEPDQIKLIDGKEITIPGKSAGLACVESVSDTLNRSLLIRQWRPIDPGYHAYEFHNAIYALQLYLSPAFPEDHFFIGARFHFNPLASLDYGLQLHYMQITDSYDEKDHGFTIGGYVAPRLSSMPGMITRLQFGIDLHLPFKNDDAGNVATAPVISGTAGISASFMLTQKTDFEVGIGYRLSSRSSNWTYSVNEETYDALWLDSPPRIDISGFYFTLGYKFLMF